MTIAFVNVGAFTGSLTPVASAYGAGAATDLIIHLLGGKPFGSAFTNANNTEIGTAATSGSVANGNGVGSVRASAFQRNTSPTSAGTDSFAATSGSPTMGRAYRYSKTLDTWDVAQVPCSDSVELGTTVSASGTLGAAGQFAAGDHFLISVVIKDDVPNHTSQALSIDGCTLSAITWETKGSTTTGNDGAQYVGRGTITAGSSTNAGAVSYTATSSVSGASTTAVNVVRIRELASGVNLGQVVETETAPHPTAARLVRLGQVVETETAPHPAVVRIIPLGQVVETETAPHPTAARLARLGQAVETETAQPVTLGTGDTIVPLGQVVETETAPHPTAARLVRLGQPTETETAPHPSAVRLVRLGQVVETETAPHPAVVRIIKPGQVVETETAPHPTAARLVRLGQAVETESAQPVTVDDGSGTIAANLGQVVETETAPHPTAVRLVRLGQVVETETARPFGRVNRLVRLSQPTEAETAPHPTAARLVRLSQPTEAETAPHPTAARLVRLSQPTEAELAQPVTVDAGQPVPIPIADLLGRTRPGTRLLGRQTAAADTKGHAADSPEFAGTEAPAGNLSGGRRDDNHLGSGGRIS